MSKSLGISDVADLRRSLINLASLMLLMVLFTGIVGLFSVWSLNGFHKRQALAYRQVTVAVEQAREARLSFKNQSLAWNYILLRGFALNDRERYSELFHLEMGKTLDALGKLPESIKQLQAMSDAANNDVVVDYAKGIDVPKIIEDLKALNEAYQSTLDVAAVNESWDPMFADGLLKGADSDLSLRIDAIAENLLAAADKAAEIGKVAEANRFETLSRLVWTGLSIALVMVALMLWRILKHAALSR